MAFPTKTSSGGSGSQKLAAFRKKAAERASPGESPSEYRSRVSAPSATTPTQSGQAPPSMVTAGLVEEFARAPGTVPSPEVTGPPSVISMPSGFRAVQERFSPQAGLTAADITRRGQEATIEAQRAGFKATQDFELSPFSQRAFAQSQQIAKTIREKTPDISTGGIVGTKEIGESVARFAEMGGMIPGGVETIARRPEVITPALTYAAMTTPKALATSAKEEPTQFISDIAVAAALGYGAGELAAVGTKAIKTKVPAVEFKTTPQEPLIKIKVPEGEPIPEIKPATFKQAEFIEGVTPETGLFGRMGEGKFKITDVPVGEVITQPKPAQTIPALIGETKGGFTDVYFKVDKPTVRAIGEQFTGEITQIKTPEGSFLAFEPTAPKTPTTITPKAETVKLPKPPEFKAIGDMAEVQAGFKFESPFRLAKRVDLEPSAIELKPVSDVVKQPDFIEVTAKPIPDIKQLESGLVFKEMPRTREFFKSTEATLAPRDKIYTTRKPTFVGEMEPFKQRVIFKEPQKAELASFLKSDLEAIMARETPITQKQPFKPETKIEIKSPTIPTRKGIPVSIFPLSATVPKVKPTPFEFIGRKTRPDKEFERGPIPDTKIKTIPDTKTEYDTEPIIEFKTQFEKQTGVKTLSTIQPIKTPKIPTIKLKNGEKSKTLDMKFGFKERLTRNPFKEMK